MRTISPINNCKYHRFKVTYVLCLVMTAKEKEFELQFHRFILFRNINLGNSYCPLIPPPMDEKYHDYFF